MHLPDQLFDPASRLAPSLGCIANAGCVKGRYLLVIEGMNLEVSESPINFLRAQRNFSRSSFKAYPFLPTTD
jgi:hypothetical protein